MRLQRYRHSLLHLRQDKARPPPPALCQDATNLRERRGGGMFYRTHSRVSSNDAGHYDKFEHLSSDFTFKYLYLLIVVIHCQGLSCALLIAVIFLYLGPTLLYPRTGPLL